MSFELGNAPERTYPINPDQEPDPELESIAARRTKIIVKLIFYKSKAVVTAVLIKQLVKVLQIHMDDSVVAVHDHLKDHLDGNLLNLADSGGYVIGWLVTEIIQAND